MNSKKKAGWVWRYVELARLSAGASLLIGLGNYVLLKIGEPVGPFLFAFGLLGVCVLGLNLFTGKCGFLFEDGLKASDLLIILAVNVIAGYLFGVIFGVMDGAIVSTAEAKVASWSWDWSFFFRSIMCGVIMYLAVKLNRCGTKLGILLGVPLFIFCGFQHSIANAITMGVAVEFSWAILLCALGNFVGAIVAWSFCWASGKMILDEDDTESEIEEIEESLEDGDEDDEADDVEDDE